MTETTVETTRGRRSIRPEKWIRVDKPGEFAMIAKSSLHIDYRYQRKYSEDKILKLANEWSWIPCGTLAVSLREDGEWYVMDGQHRLLAAMKRDEITEMPCMVYDVETVKDEAKAFLTMQTNRRPISSVDKFNALLMTESHVARVANELIIVTGRKVQRGKSAGGFRAVQVVMDCVAENEAVLRKVWPIIIELCGSDHVMGQSLISGLWFLQCHTDQDLSRAHWRRRIVGLGYDKIMNAINQSGAYHGFTNRKSAAIGIANAINHGLRNKLEHAVTIG